eukprot:gene11523-biopygen9194
MVNKQDWPADIDTAPSEETERELQPIKEILKVAIPAESVLDKVLEKFEYWKAMRVTAWIFRFIWNLKAKKSQRIKGPLSTKEIQNQITQWIRRVESRATASESFKADEQRLNIQRNNEDILECRGRIQGQFPIYLPTNALFTEKLVMNNHVYTGHGGVSLTMSSIRERFWVPRLRQLVKKLRLKCAGCKRFHAKAFVCPPPGILPKDRTEGNRPFEVISIDYAGPIRYKCKGQIERKAYILLFTCSLTRAVYIETVTDMTVEQFIPCLKGLIARRRRPSNIYSDNAKTFISGAKKLKVILKKLKEVMLDVETSLNNRPLCYLEDDIQMPELTPNVMMLGSNNVLLQEDIHSIKQGELRKRAKYIERCKENVWRRWSNEYVKALREKHNLMHHSKDNQISVGDVVLIKGEMKNRGQWRIGVVESLIQGKGGIFRAARLRSKNARIERAVQMLYSLELNCDMDSQGTKVKGNEGAQLRAEAKEFRPKRKAATIAEEMIKETLDDEERELADD